ncbi:MAG: transposase, partial [Planctomycetota bacterium]
MPSFSRSSEPSQPPERRDQPVPPHPNPTKERAIRNRGNQPSRTTLWRFAGVDLTQIDGISPKVARVVLTEVGPDLSAFPSEHDFVSWLRLCPRTPISGGKPLRKRRNGLGANRVAAALRMAATSLQRSMSALGASFRRCPSATRRSDGPRMSKRVRLCGLSSSRAGSATTPRVNV